jgi:hypothetical protein
MIVMIPACPAKYSSGVINDSLRRTEATLLRLSPTVKGPIRVLGGFVSGDEIYYVCVIPWRARWRASMNAWLATFGGFYLRLVVPSHTGLTHHWVAPEGLTPPDEQPVPEFWNTPDYTRGVYSWYATTKKERERGHQILP